MNAQILATESFAEAGLSASQNSIRGSVTARLGFKATPKLHAQKWDARAMMTVPPERSVTI